MDRWDCDGERDSWAQFLCHNLQQGCPFFPCSTQFLVRFPNKCLWPQGAVTSTSPCLQEAQPGKGGRVSQPPQGTGTLRPQPPSPPGSQDSYSAQRGQRTEHCWEWQCAAEQGPCSYSARASASWWSWAPAGRAGAATRPRQRGSGSSTWLLRASSGTTILRPQTQGNSGWSPGGLPLQGRKFTVITSFCCFFLGGGFWESFNDCF